MKPNILFFLLMILSITITNAQEDSVATTTFKFGGFINADFIHTWYQNGDVGPESPLRDFHVPGQIPVGSSVQHLDLDYHVKSSRFNFDVQTKVLGKEIHGFIELDFLLSKAGDEKVSNSFNPRLRHAFFEWNRMLIGQTWSTFMVVTVPDEMDLSGAMDGLVFIRQPQIRFKLNDWWFSVENPETTYTKYQDAAVEISDAEILPDIVVRRNFNGAKINWSIAGMMRTLHKRDSLTASATGFGLTTGGKIHLGQKGDDLRMMATYGHGLGRYLSSNFVSSGVVDNNNKFNPTNTFNWYFAYNHFWANRTLSSSFSIASFHGFHDDNLVGTSINKSSYSLSGNIKWDIVPTLRIGLEYMYGYRELLDGTNGAFHRLQFAAKYAFGYLNTAINEKS